MMTDNENLAEDAAFAADLARLAESIQPNSDFKMALEQRLRHMTDDSHPTFNHSIQGESKIMTYNPKVPRYVAVAASLLIVAAVTLALPPLRSFAQEVIDLLFSRAASDTEIFDTPIVLQLQSTPTVVIQELQPSFSIEQVEEQAGFDVLEPVYLPAGYTLQDVYYDEGGGLVSQFFTNGGLGINLVQMRASAVEPMDVGASAEIIDVEIGDVVGQYVEGGWIVAGSTPQGDNAVRIDGQVWDSDFPFSQLRWQVGDTVFWIMTTMGQKNELPLSEWQAMAESLQ